MVAPVADASVFFWIPIRNPDKVYVTAPSNVEGYVRDAVTDFDSHTDLEVHMGKGPFFGTTKVKVLDVNRPDIQAYGYAELRTATRTCAAMREVWIGGRRILMPIMLRDRKGRPNCDEDDRVSRITVYLNRAKYPLKPCTAGIGTACLQGLAAHEMMHGFGFIGHDCANRILKAPECSHESNRTLSAVDVSDVNARY